MDAPLWMAIRLAVDLFPWVRHGIRLLPLEGQPIDPATPVMLLVAVATMVLAPTAIASSTLLLCVAFDAVRACRYRHALIRWLRSGPWRFSKREWFCLVVAWYDAVLLPLMLLCWAAIPALFTLTNESPHASTSAVAVYLVAIPGYYALNHV
jgi:hypothetical protein